MKKLIIIILLIGFAIPVLAKDSKEVLELKRSVLAERAMRIQNQLELAKYQYKELQQTLEATRKEYKSINDQLKALEVKGAVDKEGKNDPDSNEKGVRK